MIEIQINLIPFGIGEPKSLGKIIIGNDGTGTENIGNYNIKFFDRANRQFKTTRLEKWPRMKKSIWQMIKKIFEEEKIE
jgi:hypothetical protein